MEKPISHEQHLKIMLEKILQEIKSCEACTCHHCQIKKEKWVEEYIQTYIQVYGDYPEIISKAE